MPLNKYSITKDSNLLKKGIIKWAEMIICISFFCQANVDINSYTKVMKIPYWKKINNKRTNVALAKSSNYLNKTKQILFEAMYSSEEL